MTDEAKNCECSTFAELFEKKEIGLSLSAQEELSLSNHCNDCRSCQAMRNQHEQINQLASMMPQFDISEGLTQKILESVNTQTTPAVETPLLPVALVAAVLFIIMVPFDSVQTLLGWAAGLLGMFALQGLMQTASTQEQVTYK